MISRRKILKWGGLSIFFGGGLLSASAGPGRQPMKMSTPDRNKVLVVVFLRGGLDGMHALVPHASEHYRLARPNLAVPRGAILELNETFGLHPAMKHLMPHYRSGQLACLCAVGTEDQSRSHFVAQDYLEFGGASPRDGWLNRHLSRHGLALSTRTHLPSLIKGKNPVMNISSVSDLEQMIRGPVSSGNSDLSRLSREEQKFAERLAKIKLPGENGYPDTKLGHQLRMVAHLLKSGVELESVHTELSGFDTHSRQVDGLWPGHLVGLNSLLWEFSVAVDHFWRDLGELQQNVTLMTVTEFGRRLAENSSLGTDHGLASACFVLGGTVQGGQVYGNWPGLSPDVLVDGLDLPVTTDYRHLLTDYTEHCGSSNLFPEMMGSYEPLGLFREP